MTTFKRVNCSDTQVFNYTDSTESRLVRILNSNQNAELKLDFILDKGKTNDPFFLLPTVVVY